MKKPHTLFRLVLLFFMIVSVAFGQASKIDSLKNKLQDYKVQDSIRVGVLNELAHAIHRIDIEKAKEYVEESNTIAKQIGFKNGEARSIYIKGIIEGILTDYENGLQYYEEAIALYEANNSKKGIAECYKGLGTFFFYKGDRNKAIEYYKKAIVFNEEINDDVAKATVLRYIAASYLYLGDHKEALDYGKKSLAISEDINDDKGISGSLNVIASVYNYQSNFPVALEFYKKALVIHEKMKDTTGIINLLTNIGTTHYGQKQYKKAIEYYKQALAFNDTNADVFTNIGLAYNGTKQFTLALKYLQDGLKIYRRNGNKTYIATCLNNIGYVYVEQNKLTKALQYFEQSKIASEEIQYKLSLCNSFLGLGKVYLLQKKYDKALSHLLQSKQLAEELGALNNERDIAKLLTQVYKAKDNYKMAFHHHERYKMLADSIFNKENIEKMTQLESEYKYKQALDSARIRELQLTKTVELTSQNLAKSEQNLLIGVILFLGIIIIMGSSIFLLKLRNIASKTENIVIEQKLLRSQMTPHFIFNSLSVLQGMIINKEEKKSVKYLLKFSRLLRIILENSRDKTVLLSDELAAIKNYLALQNLENNACQYTITVAQTIDASQFIIPPMVIQPFVENAIEHAFAEQKGDRKIDIHFKYSDSKLICTIIDNGIGYQPQQKEKNNHKKSLSSVITSERLKILSKEYKMQGALSIENRQQYNEQGTIVKITLPHKILNV